MCTMPSVTRRPFFYVIKNEDTDIKYAGVKFAKNCKPDDLLTTYFTSSKIVKALMGSGSVFVIEDIVEFLTKEEAIEFEEFFLTEANAHMSKDWYNQAIGKAINPETARATSQAKYGVDNWMQSAEGREFIRVSKLGNTNTKGQKRSQETKDKMSKSFMGRVYSDETKINMSKAMLGKKASQATKDKMSEGRARGKHPRAIQISTPDGNVVSVS
jgi:hypothetical protein